MGHSSSKSLSKEDIQYLEDNTNFSKCKIMEYYKKFKKQNPDGFITRDQFLEMTSSLSPSENSRIMNEHLFRAADKDGTGKINFKEMLLMLNLRFTHDPKERLGWVFDLYDIDGNGSIEREEMIKIFTKQNPDGFITRDQFLEMTSSLSPSENSRIMNEHLFRAADKDGTGKINFKEMLLMLNLRFTHDPKERLGWVFDLYDIDGNGSIEREEMIKIFTLMLSVTSNQEGPQQQEEEGHQKQNVLTPESVTNTIFHFCDVDKSGSISKEEFINGGLKDPNLVQFLGGIAGK